MFDLVRGMAEAPLDKMLWKRAKEPCNSLCVSFAASSAMCKKPLGSIMCVQSKRELPPGRPGRLGGTWLKERCKSLPCLTLNDTGANFLILNIESAIFPSRGYKL